jgi:hypothetical protein
MQVPSVEVMPGYGSNHPSRKEKAYTPPGIHLKPPSAELSEKLIPRRWQEENLR